MSQNRIVVGDKLQCIEQTTGQAGVLHVEQDRVWVEFVGFGQPPCVNAERPIFLHTTAGFVVTLANNVDLSSSMPRWRKGDVKAIYTQRIISNFPIYGETGWADDDLVSTVYFNVAPDCPFLWSKDKAAAIVGTPIEATPEHEILELECSVGTIRLFFGYESGRFDDRWVPTTPYFSIHFSTEVTTKIAVHQANHVASLFTLLSWEQIEPTNISFTRHDDEPRFYQHRLLDTETPPSTLSSSRLQLVPLSVDTEDDRKAFKGTLGAWMEKEKEWDEVVPLMQRSQKTFRHYSMERVLDACRWHEALNRTNGKPEAPPEMMEVIDAAEAKARECGLVEYVGWIKGQLKAIRGEPRAQLFGRLCAEVNAQLKHPTFDLSVTTQMLQGAYASRNATGHGSASSHSAAEARIVMGDTLAMEALNLSRLISNLSLAENKQHLLQMHPLLRGFAELQQERIKSAENPA